jgi:hypothetical protein
VKGYSSRTEHMKDRISELKDKIEFKEKTELLIKHLKSKGRNMQKLNDSIKIPT